MKDQIRVTITLPVDRVVNEGVPAIVFHSRLTENGVVYDDDGRDIGIWEVVG